MNLRRICAIIVLAVLCLCQTAFAEDSYIDLGSRFSDIATYDHNGVTYYIKGRVSTTLVLCADLNDDPSQGVGRLELVMLVAIDEDTDTVVPIQLLPGTVASWLDGEDGTKTVAQLFNEAESPQAACEKLLQTVNLIFPEDEMVEHYFMLDVSGLAILDGIDNDEFNTTGEALVERLKGVYNTIEDGTGDPNEMLSSMSGYIHTDMKSGALMKVIDKCDRYDRSSRVPFPVLNSSDEAAVEFIADTEAFVELMLSVYYEDTKPW